MMHIYPDSSSYSWCPEAHGGAHGGRLSCWHSASACGFKSLLWPPGDSKPSCHLHGRLGLFVSSSQQPLLSAFKVSHWGLPLPVSLISECRKTSAAAPPCPLPGRQSRRGAARELGPGVMCGTWDSAPCARRPGRLPGSRASCGGTGQVASLLRDFAYLTWTPF